MEKKGFLLLVGLLGLIVVACATTSSTPSLPASDSPKVEQSASAAAPGTPDNSYQVLIGEWRGLFTNGFIGTLTVHEIDIVKAKARCTFDISGSDLKAPGLQDMPVRADFIPGPSPKLKWEYSSGRGQWEFVLKDNVLAGTCYIRGMYGPPRIASTIKMEKYLKK